MGCIIMVVFVVSSSGALMYEKKRKFFHVRPSDFGDTSCGQVCVSPPRPGDSGAMTVSAPLGGLVSNFL